MFKRSICLTSFIVVLALVGNAGAQLDPSAVSTGHVYLFDDVTGNQLEDDSANSHTCNILGDPQVVAGLKGNALQFDGVDDGIEVPDSDFINVNAGPFGNRTVVIMFKCDDVDAPGKQVIFEEGGTTRGSLFYVSEGLLYAAAWNRAEYNWDGAWLSTPISSNNWYAVAMVIRDGGEAVEDGKFEMWLDGKVIATAPGGHLHNHGDDGGIGFCNQNTVFHDGNASPTDNAHYFTGAIDEIWILNVALTQAELGGFAGKVWPYAFSPEPANGALFDDTWASLAWKPGGLAVSHNLYIGTSSADVNDGAESTFVGNLTTTKQVVGFPGFPVPGGLVPGTTYYWRVDEVNEAHPDSPWKGDVWSFWLPPKTAYNANPADGVHFVKTDAGISWTAGFNAMLQYVYFGDNHDEVMNAAGAIPLTATSFSPGMLESDKTYYWRVDQFDGIETHKGDVWSFTTVPVIAVSDPSLLGWWKLDEGEGTTAVDWSGHDGHGSFVGEPQWVDGYQGSALEFDGGDFVNCGDNAATGVTADFTVAAWVKMNPGNAGQYMGICGKLSRLGGNADYMGYALVRHSSNVFRLWVGDGDAANIIGMASSDANCTDIDWHHVAGVHEGQINMLYVDGVRQAAGNATNFVPSDLFFQIGRQYSNTTTQRLFNGKIDDVRVYNKALTDAEIADVMLGDTKMAGNPVPGRDALLDMRDISSLSWSRGSTAASHDVYFGTDRDAVAGADNTAPEFQGNQAGTSLSLASLVEFGGGDYYWRIDEIEAAGAVNTGTIWKFTVPDYLIVDNFESYNDIDPPDPASNTIYGSWADGYQIPTNGALTANELPPYAEQATIRGGFQSMKYLYDTNFMISESTLTLTKSDWTVEGVTKLILWFKGSSANAAEKMFVALNGNAVVYHDDPAASQIIGWNEWIIDLTRFADQGVDLTNVTSITIGFGTKSSPAAGGAGTVYFDDIGLIR